MTDNKFSGLYNYVDSVCEKLPTDELKKNFRKCYLNTLETTVKYDDDGKVFIITGDIDAMWLRDSSVQVSHYVRLANADKDVNYLIRSLLNRQFSYILEDPYANAFNETANGKGHKDDTTQNDTVFERKYEIDSLIYPLWLVNKYYEYTNDSSVFDSIFISAYKQILDTLICEQDYKNNSDYYFRRNEDNGIDTLDNNGFGSDYKYTGMVRSGFRPSDDKCVYSFLVPSNMFIVATLRQLGINMDKAGITDILRDTAEKLCSDIEDGIKKYAITETVDFGKIYAYEVDGLGNMLLMDDANVPSLLSLPYLGYCKNDDKIYLNTRKFILSKANPYYYTGSQADGIGSPHTPENYIWHISLIMEALTSGDVDTINRIYNYLTTTTADTGFMHESFDCNDSYKFTRSWFAWANTLFAIFVIDKIIK